MRKNCHLVVQSTTLFVLLGPSLCVGQDLSKTPLPEGLVAKETAAAPAAVVCFLEGPAVDAEGNVFFSDIAGNRILKMDAKGRSPSSAPTAAAPTATPSTPRAGSSVARAASKARAAAASSAPT